MAEPKKKSTARQLADRKLAKLQDYQKTFNSEHGKRVLYDMLDVHGFMKSNFDENPLVLACREGERAVIVRILQVLKTDIEQIKKIVEKADDHVSTKNII